ncbi:hypothetical protein [Pseudonocardia yuanmonensis]|uniref:hypothetical protein n=1 Tax=Pseudonocardia yuanmonensis TaxID=1095914 RepID=UPI0031F19082
MANTPSIARDASYEVGIPAASLLGGRTQVALAVIAAVIGAVGTGTTGAAGLTRGDQKNKVSRTPRTTSPASTVIAMGHALRCGAATATG